VYDVAQKKYVPLERPGRICDDFRLEEGGRRTPARRCMTLAMAWAGRVPHQDERARRRYFEITSLALEKAETEFDGLVIGSEADNFSAGANLFMVVVAAQQGMWDTLDAAIRKLQNMNMRMRYFPKPVVVAPAGWPWAAARK
jgi:hypothetical protein